MTPRRTVSLGTGAGVVAILSVVATFVQAVPAAFQGAPTSVVPPVAPAALESLLPILDGWTKDRVTSNRIKVSESCNYAFADAIYTTGEMRLRVTLADTGFDSDGLMTLATIVVTFPANHTEVIPPSTVVTRTTFSGSPAATLWNSAKKEGEFSVVVGGRFIAKVEGRNVDSLDILRGIMQQIDLKTLAGLDAR